MAADYYFLLEADEHLGITRKERIAEIEAGRLKTVNRVYQGEKVPVITKAEVERWKATRG